MAINLKPGIVYFLRERDFSSGQLTQYCKIGLVSGNKQTEDRIRELQTGNPREIEEESSVQAAAVTRLETYLHYRFAPWRVHGEWFMFTSDQLHRAIKEAKSRSKDIERVSEALDEVQRLKNKPPNKSARSADPHEQATHAKLIDITSELNRLTAEQKIIEFQLRSSMGTARGLKGVVSVEFKTPKPDFDEGSFSEDHRELFNQFLVSPEPKVTGSFLLSGKPAKKDLPKKLAERHAKLAKLVPDLNHPDDVSADPAARDELAEQLHEKYLENLRELSQLEFDADLLEVELKVACIEHEGIEGVCTWKRKLTKSNPKFDQKSFKEACPELYESYLRKKDDTVSVVVSRGRPYRTKTDRMTRD